MAPTIYLHWSATPYTSVRTGFYHTIVSGDGHLHHLHSYTIDPNAHTWRRSSNTVAISCACRGGSPDPCIHALLSEQPDQADNQPALAFRRSATMVARGPKLAVEIDANGTSWALAADLLALDDIPNEWNPAQRRILIGSTDIGHPLFEMGLQGGNAPVILRGILRNDRAWCRVLEFAEEFGITAFFQPFALGERRRG